MNDSHPKFSMPALEELQRGIDSQRVTAEALNASIQEAQDRRWQAEDERVEREKLSLQLTEQLATAQRDLVQSQSRLLQIQRDQANESRRDRRIQYAILSVAVVALVVAISAPVALETKSVGWVLVSALGTLAVSALAAALLIRGRKSVTPS
ncbi:hypothetical protein [Nocardioides zeicaulis]|uniref:Uncharacterized protein n=1 Tax=Nocardioides zeicaulis TaxID=1776857 RepID=A0ABV6DWS7_9ACTN